MSNSNDLLPEEICGEECHRHDANRREFGALMLGLGLTAAAGSLARAAGAAVTETDVTIKTNDGTCDAVLTHPATGAHPGVIVWPDAGGLRPIYRDMAKRLAAEGFTVLTPNPFYRAIKAPLPTDFPQDQRPKLREGLSAVGGAEGDAKAFIAFLDGQASYRKGAKIGVTGYCMGGPLTMRTAGAFPDRIGAAGSFHGGGLVTDQPTSPHLLVPRIKAKYLFAVADNDDQKEPEAKNVLREAFAKAGNPADIEVFKGANHGWCVPTSQVYNHDQAERAWAKLVALFKTALV
jgi:carboxymethylenebutenolidase